MENELKKTATRAEYHRNYYNTHENVQMRKFLLHYRAKMNAGKNYVPKEWTKFAVWCKDNNLDCRELIEGRIKAPWERDV